MPRPPSDAPDRILEAAVEILKTSGPSTLSFDRLANATGLSKGGVLHHFRTRHALVEGLVDQLVAHLQQGIAARSQQDSDPVGAFRRAYGAEILAAAERRDGAEILAALVVDPSLLAPLWAFFKDARRRVATELGYTDAVVFCGSVEARWWTAVMGGPALDRTATVQLRARLEDWYR